MTYGSFLGLTVMKITYRLKRDNADKTNSLFPLTCRDAKYHCIIKICIACQITRIDIFQKIMHLMDNQKRIFIEVTENFFMRCPITKMCRLSMHCNYDSRFYNILM